MTVDMVLQGPRTEAGVGKDHRGPQIIGRHHPCGAEWASRSHSHCSGCCCHFTSAGAFAKHQQGGRCLDPAGIRTTAGRLVFKVVRRKGCNVKVWTLNNERNDDDDE